MVYEAYNLTAMGNSSGIVSLIQTVNSELMFDFYGIGVMLAIFIITFFAFLKSTGGDATKSLAGASFIIFGLSTLFVLLDLLPAYIMYIALILTALSVVSIKNA